MTTPFDAGVRALEREAGSDAPARILRTELREDGVIVFTLSGDLEPTCYAWAAEHLERLEPESETALPCAPTLIAGRRAGAGRILAWRPGRRMVVLLGEERGERVVKAWRKRRSTAALENHERARAGLEGHFVVPRLLVSDDRLDAAQFECLRGHAPDFSDLAWCHRVGRGIAALQRNLDRAVLPRHGRAQEIAVLQDLAGRHRRALGGLPSGFDDTLFALQSRVEERRALSVAAHRDLHDGQFSVAGDRTALFDFDLAACAEPELDLANLSAHVTWCGLQGQRGVDPGTSRDAIAALCAGHGGDLDERAFGFYTATTALRLALVWGVRPRWAALARTLVDVARVSTEEVSRA